MTRVSVVIPTLNAGPQFEELLKQIRSQKGDFDLEILVIDSGSTDATRELALRYGATVHQIERQEFNHGATRNLGISLARGEYVALTVQDAVPLDERWLAMMVENLERNGRVAGVYSRQIPHKNAGVLTRVLVGNLATASLERREQFAESPTQYARMRPKKRRRLAVYDDVSSCLRRSVWEELPYDATDFGEDIRWGKKVVEAGYKVVYEPRSAVLHSHERGAVYDLKRYYMDQRVLLELFGLSLVPNLAHLLLGIARSSLHLYRLLRREKELAASGALVLVLLAVKYAVPAQVGNYLGARSGSIARLSPRAYGRLHGYLSRGI